MKNKIAIIGLALLAMASAAEKDIQIPTINGGKLGPVTVSPAASSVFVWDADKNAGTSLLTNFATPSSVTAAQAFSIDRANHTGIQAQSTIADLETTLAGKAGLADELTFLDGVTFNSSTLFKNSVSFDSTATFSYNPTAANEHRLALAVRPGIEVQGFDSDLATWAGVTPTAPVATFLATPSSANLAAALTTKTGTGNAVFDTSPSLVTPVLGAATGTSLTLSNGSASAPAIKATDADSGIWFSGNNTRFAVDGTNAFNITGGTQRVRLASASAIGWSATDDAAGTIDTVLARNASGVLEINNGTGGNYRDVIARNLTASGTLGVTGATTLGTTGSAGNLYIQNATPATRVVLGFNGTANPGLYLGASSLISWSSDNNPSSAGPDTVVSRAAPGVVGVPSLTASGGITPGASTVAALPAAASNIYQIRVVTDALAPVMGSTVAAGGSAKATVQSNGTNWIVLLAL